MRRTKISALLLAVLLTVSCAKTIRPGAVDQADSRAFDVLGTAYMSLEVLKKDCPSGPTSPCPQSKKDAINHMGDAYNVARQAWLTYREAILTGKPTDSNTLNVLISRLITAGAETRRLIQ
jgi:hypothetical protein